MAEPPVYQEATYLISAAELSQLPPDKGCEVAFIGRSNAGKSSALNVITGIKGLARTSKTPGRTQMINFFSLDNDCKCRLVDLPGYGYAKVPLMVKERWELLIDEYLRKRKSLKGLVVIMDIRHPLKEMDRAVIDWAMKCKIPIHILLTKTDKLSASAAKKTLKEVQEALKRYGKRISMQLFSSMDRTGLDDVKAVLDAWYCA
ncbi:ribosome biogenesis GTP-binding protein YihA/YsxC [Candidiatus Paracoxiella cheracis]|uniref:ribosome biogenesis GTP-binding protein YihA/YsxC n=1 Tax=Candidiatus Paracoxiella cheracis TaxID=3405120 RepID=UPI003BF6120D